MRSLTKEPKPAVLIANETAWTLEYQQADPPKPSRWGHAEIRESLERETYEKCAYCEGFIEAVAWTHVEHILPKSRFPQLVVSWENLTLACPKCNVAKGDYWSAEAELINPYVDDPRQHLVWAGALVFGAVHSAKGARTVRRLNLGRSQLRESRETRLKSVESLLRLWEGAVGPDKEMYAQAIQDEVKPEREYSEAVRHWLGLMGFPLAG